MRDQEIARAGTDGFLGKILLSHQPELFEIRPLPAARRRLYCSLNSKIMKMQMVNPNPQIVATFLVKRLTMASANRASVISPSPTGISRPPNAEIERDFPLGLFRLF